MTPLEAVSQRFAEYAPPTQRVGIYLLVSDGEIVYVGSSTDVDTRIATHYREARLADQETRKVFDRALWYPRPESVLAHYEGALIRALRPKYNARAPRGGVHDAEIIDGFDLAMPDDIEVAPMIAGPRAEAPPGIAANIRAARERAGLTQMQLAQMSGCECKTSVSHWETGKSAPTRERLPAVALALGVTVEQLNSEATP